MADIKEKQMRDAFIAKLLEYARKDRDIIFLSNEYGAPALDDFRRELPSQFINAAISEQNLISVAAGMSMEGKKVFIYSIASFVTLRCYEQLKLDLCAMKLPATILSGGVGYSYSFDGPTHHATEDISIMRALAFMNIYSPADNSTVDALVDLALENKELSYIRFEKGAFKRLYPAPAPLGDGAAILREGKDLLIFATGCMTHRALEAAELLSSENIHCKVIDVFRLKPFPEKFAAEQAKSAKSCISLEEHTINGGLGSILAETFTDNGVATPLKRLAVKDQYLYAYGNRDVLNMESGLDVKSICELVRKTVNIR